MTTFFKDLHTIQTALGQMPSGDNTSITGWSIDSRTLKKGEAFIALTGELPAPFITGFEGVNDGHSYLAKAQEAGASCAIVSTPNPDVDLPQIIVKDTFQALWTLAQYVRSHTQAKVIGITGSAGKTTCKDMLVALLKAHGPVSSYNNAWGVPLTMLRLPQNQHYCVLEIGMNQKGELAELAKLAQPDVAVVLNTLPVHTEGTGGVDGVVKEKLSIAEGLTENGTLLLHSDIPTDQHLNFNGNTILFGRGTENHLTDDNQAQLGTESIPFTIENPSVPRQTNALVALLIAQILGEDVPHIAPRLATSTTPTGRGNHIKVGDITLIDDSYNANPASVRAALKNLRDIPCNGKRYALLGDIRELGESEEHYHANLAKYCINIDGIFTCGTLMQHLANALPQQQHLQHFTDVEHIDFSTITDALQPLDILLIKGSNGVFYQANSVQRIKEALERLA